MIFNKLSAECPIMQKLVKVVLKAVGWSLLKESYSLGGNTLCNDFEFVFLVAVLTFFF